MTGARGNCRRGGQPLRGSPPRLGKRCAFPTVPTGSAAAITFLGNRGSTFLVRLGYNELRATEIWRSCRAATAIPQQTNFRCRGQPMPYVASLAVIAPTLGCRFRFVPRIPATLLRLREDGQPRILSRTSSFRQPCQRHPPVQRNMVRLVDSPGSAEGCRRSGSPPRCAPKPRFVPNLRQSLQLHGEDRFHEK